MMLLLLSVVAVFFTMQTTFGQQQTKSGIDPTVCATMIDECRHHHDPTDYVAVVDILERASGLGVRERRSRSARPDSTKRFNLSKQFNAGYRRETGPLVAVTLTGDYRKGTLSLGVGASVKGWYYLRVAGRNPFSNGDRVLTYETVWEQFPTYFYGLGYSASKSNARTTYKRVTQEVRVVGTQRLVGHLWIDAALRYGRDWARKMPARGWNYLLQADEMVTSITSTALIVALRYDDRQFKDGTAVRGVRLRVAQEVRPHGLSNSTSTLWHTSFLMSGYYPLWQGAVWESDITSDFWSQTTPWLLWPSVGNDKRLLIYSYGRYVDRNMVSVHITLHQTIYGPIGCEVWGGAVNMFSDKFMWRHTLPSYGLGVRVIANNGLIIKAGYGFGRHTHGLVIGVNELF